MVTQLTNGHKLESQKFEKSKIFFIDRLELVPWVSLGFPTFFSCYHCHLWLAYWGIKALCVDFLGDYLNYLEVGDMTKIFITI